MKKITLSIAFLLGFVATYAQSEKTNGKERKASAKFIKPVGFSLDGARGVYKSQ
jgi:hypothetical protein